MTDTYYLWLMMVRKSIGTLINERQVDEIKTIDCRRGKYITVLSLRGERLTRLGTLKADNLMVHTDR